MNHQAIKYVRHNAKHCKMNGIFYDRVKMYCFFWRWKKDYLKHLKKIK